MTPFKYNLSNALAAFTDKQSSLLLVKQDFNYNQSNYLSLEDAYLFYITFYQFHIINKDLLYKLQKQQSLQGLVN